MTTNTASSTSGQPRLDSEVDPNYRIDVSNLDTRVLWRITAIAFSHHWRMALAICATILAGTFQLFVPQYVGQAVDQVQGLLAGAADGDAREAARDALLHTALLLMGASVLRGLFTMVQNYQGEAVGQIIGYHLRLDYYRKLQTLSYSWHDRVHSGDLMTRGILDIEGMRLWVGTGILRLFLLTVLICGGAFILIDIDTTLGLLALSFVPIVGIRASIARIKLRTSWTRLQEKLSELTKVMEENLGGIRVVRAFAAQAFELARFDLPVDELL